MKILKWATLGLLVVSVLPIVAHGLFYFPILKSYIELGIIFGITYFGYKKSKEIWHW